jgi:hypothetical protein
MALASTPTPSHISHSYTEPHLAADNELVRDTLLAEGDPGGAS